MQGHLDARTRQERSRRLHELEERLRRDFQDRVVGQEETLLVESKVGPGGRFTGLCSNYLRVELLDDGGTRPAPNEFWRVRLDKGEDCRLALATPLVRTDR